MSEFTKGVTAPDAGGNQDKTNKDYLGEFVGEGKRFETVEEAAKELAKKAVNADSFIEQLKAEKRELEAKYNELETTSRSVDEIVEALKENTQLAPNKPADVGSEGAVSEVDIKKTVQELLQEERHKQELISKTNAAWKQVTESFGSLDKAKAAVGNYIGGDEEKKALVDKLAVTDPNALVAILSQQSSGVSFTDDNSGVTPPRKTVTDKLTWEEVRKVRKENPKLYNSREFKARMHEEL